MTKRLAGIIILVAYTGFLIKILVFKDVPVIRFGALMFKFGGTQHGAANFVPFSTIFHYLSGRNGLTIGAVNLIGNIVLLVPVGFFICLAFGNTNWIRSLAFAAGLGLVIETLQALLRVGIFDVDDVILNASGVMIGYWCSLLLARARKSKTQ